jgi:large subunit ribosomal protein L22
MNKQIKEGTEHIACASAKNISVSTKHSAEICKSLRYKNVSYAKRFLEEVAELKRAVPFKRYNKNVAHKKGMMAGRFPQKAAKEMLALIKSAESNAQFKGLDTSNLKIIKLLANKASIPLTGGRHRRGTKRTHLEIEVKEVSGVDKKKAKVAKNVKLDDQKNIKKEVKEPVKENKEVKEKPVNKVEENKQVKEEKTELIKEEEKSVDAVEKKPTEEKGEKQ